jgi:hypothetical protein
MNDVVWLLLLGVQHWVFDWALQTRRMGDGKSKSWLILGEHVAVVTMGLALVGGTFFGLMGFAWAALNAALHFATDAITSRLTSRFFKAGRIHAFFTTIGADQWLLHYPALLLTSAWLLGVPS